MLYARRILISTGSRLKKKSFFNFRVDYLCRKRTFVCSSCMLYTTAHNKESIVHAFCTQVAVLPQNNESMIFIQTVFEFRNLFSNCPAITISCCFLLVVFMDGHPPYFYHIQPHCVSSSDVVWISNFISVEFRQH